MPSDADAIAIFQSNGVIYAPGKASNAGGVAVSGLEMSQNSVRQYATFAVLDEQLKTIMKNIHDDCFNHGKQADGSIDFDFLPLLKQGDSCSQTVKPDRKNVLGGINISIMPCATRCTSPFSYSQTCSTAQATGHIATARASLGSVFLIHDFKTATCVLAFVGQLSFEFKPACIVNRFGEFAFFTIKLITLNITDHD